MGRWLWPTLAVSGFLAVVVYVFAHDDPAPGLSARGLLTVALAAVVAVLLTIHRRHGPRRLARAVAEYAAVALLAALLAAPGVGIDQQPANHPASGQTRAQAATGDDQPAVIRAVNKVLRGWRRGDPGRDRRGPLAGRPVAPGRPAGHRQGRGHGRPGTRFPTLSARSTWRSRS